MNNRLLITKKNSIFHTIPYAIFTGFASGIAVSLYTLFIEYASKYSNALFALAGENRWYIFLIVGILALAFTISSLMIRLSNVSRGSGVPQAIGLLRGSFIMNAVKGFSVMFVISVVGTLAGLSLGSEGPSMLIGAAAAMAVSKMFPMYTRQYMISGGVGAGLAVAFNAPLSGTAIVLEEGHRRFSPVIAFNTMLTVFTAVVTANVILGERIIIPVTDFSISLIDIPFLIITGVAVAFFGILFSKLILIFKKGYKRLKFKRVDLRFLPPFILALFIGLFLLPASGGGIPLIKSLIDGNYAIKMLVILFVVKLLFTTLSTSSGIPGGIFVPMLAVGATIGGILSSLLGSSLDVHASLFIVGAMVAFFTAVSHSFFTAGMLAVELTGNVMYAIPAIIVCGTVKIILRIVKSHGLYDTILKQTVKDNTDGFEEKTTFIAFVQKNSFLDSRRINDVILPDGVRLVKHVDESDSLITEKNARISANDMLTFEIETLDNFYAKNVILSLATSKNRDDELDGVKPNIIL